MNANALPSRRWPLTLGLVAAALALLTLSGCSGLTALNLVTPASGYERLPEQAYGSAARQRLDVYRPEGTAPAGGWPVVVFFYGGSWREGHRGDYRFVAQALAAQGVMTVVPDYRLYPEAGWREILQDCAQATVWVQRQIGRFDGNRERITLVGHSAGAYNVAMLALDARWLNGAGSSTAGLHGWVGIAGPYDFVPIRNPDVIPVFGGPTPPAESQPLHHARTEAQRPLPVLLMAPGADKVVDPERNSAVLAQALAAAGVPVQLQPLPGVSHGTAVGAFAWPLRGQAPVLDGVARFAKGPR
jgi:acetyl esterase/lipase